MRCYNSKILCLVLASESRADCSKIRILLPTTCTPTGSAHDGFGTGRAYSSYFRGE